MSRTSPSVTRPAMPRFSAMPIMRSPVTAAPLKGPVAATRMSPRSAIDIAPKREIVARPAVAGERDSDHDLRGRLQRLDRKVERPAPAHRVDHVACLRAGEGGDEARLGPLKICAN